MVGINNRDLRTFETSLFTTVNMLHMVPPGCFVVTESGIHSRDDVKFMRDHEVNAFLVGEAFMRAPDPGQSLAEIFQYKIETDIRDLARAKNDNRLAMR